MEFLSNPVVLSRMQFALTALFHMLWPVLTTGMGIYLVIVEGLRMLRDYFWVTILPPLHWRYSGGILATSR